MSAGLGREVALTLALVRGAAGMSAISRQSLVVMSREGRANIRNTTPAPDQVVHKQGRLAGAAAKPVHSVTTCSSPASRHASRRSSRWRAFTPLFTSSMIWSQPAAASCARWRARLCSQVRALVRYRRFTPVAFISVKAATIARQGGVGPPDRARTLSRRVVPPCDGGCS